MCLNLYKSKDGLPQPVPAEIGEQNFGETLLAGMFGIVIKRKV